MAEEATSGLDSLSPGAVIKAAPVKGGISVPGNNMLDATQTEALLANMQDLINQRSVKNPLGNAIQDMQAGFMNKTAEREQYKQQQAQDLFNMRAQMAAIRGNQATQQRLAQEDAASGWGPQVGGQPQQNQPQQGQAQGNALPQDITMQDVQTYRQLMAVDPQQALKFKQKLLEQGQAARVGQIYSPTNSEIVTVSVNGQEQQMTRGQAAKLLNSGVSVQPMQSTGVTSTGSQSPDVFQNAVSGLLAREGGYNPKDGASGAPVNFGINQKANPDIDVKNLTAEQAKSLYKSRYWDAIDADKLPPQSAEIALDAAANQGVEYAKKLIQSTGGEPRKMLQQRTNDYLDLAKDPTQASNLTSWLGRIADLNKRITTAPTTPSIGNKTEMELNKKRAEAKIDLEKKDAENKMETAKKEKDQASVDAGKRQSSLIDNAQKATKMELAADAIANIAKDPSLKNISGIGKRGWTDPKSAAVTALQMIPFAHMDEKKANDLVARSTLSQHEQSMRDELDKQAADLGVDYAAQIFHGARMGIGLENMAQKTKGVGSEYTPETNLMNAQIIKQGAQFNRARHQMWIDYQATHGGDDASFAKFEEEPQYRALEDSTRAALAKQFPTVFKVEDDSRVNGLGKSEPEGTQTTKSGIKYRIVPK